jgi:hypothetical protein
MRACARLRRRLDARRGSRLAELRQGARVRHRGDSNDREGPPCSMAVQQRCHTATPSRFLRNTPDLDSDTDDLGLRVVRDEEVVDSNPATSTGGPASSWRPRPVRAPPVSAPSAAGSRIRPAARTRPRAVRPALDLVMTVRIADVPPDGRLLSGRRRRGDARSGSTRCVRSSIMVRAVREKPRCWHCARATPGRTPLPTTSPPDGLLANRSPPTCTTNRTKERG